MEEIILNLTGSALDNLNYWWIILFMAIESSFIPFPSEVVMIPAAYMAAETGEMNYAMVIISGTIGALIGALVNYMLSMTLGRTIIYAFANSRIGHMMLIDAEKVREAEEYFDKHGAVSTLIGRMIPAIRQLISIPAGLARMNMAPFVLYTCLGAAIWNTILVSLGAAFHTVMNKDELMAIVSKYSHIIGIAALALCALIICFLIYKGVKKQDGSRSTHQE